MYKTILEPQALKDIEFWTQTNIKMLKKIFELIKQCTTTPYEGIGKPEALKYDLQGV